MDPAEMDFTLFRFAIYRAQVAGMDLEFWASNDVKDVLLEGALKDEATAEESLPAAAFMDFYSGHIGENLRCGCVYDCVPRLCEALGSALDSLQTDNNNNNNSNNSNNNNNKNNNNNNNNNPAAGQSEMRILELGAGMGLPGLWAGLWAAKHVDARPGIKVVLTDRHPGVLELLGRNVHLSGASTFAEVRSLSWDERPGWLKDFDVVIAADVLYEAGMQELFFAVAAAALRPGGTLLLAYKERNLPSLDFQQDVMPHAAAAGLQLCAGAVPASKCIEVFRFELAVRS